MQPNQVVAIKRIVVAAVILVIIGLVLSWVYNTSIIQVTVTNSNQSEQVRFILRNQQSGEETVVEDTKLNKRVRKGAYEVSVIHGDSTHFKVVETKGFFRTVSYEATTKKEGLKRVVGKNPQPCATLAEGTLISFACGDSIDSIGRHVPANRSTPTYVMKNTNASVFGDAQKIIQTTDGKVYALYREVAEVPEGLSAEELRSNMLYAIHHLNAQLNTIERFPLPTLDAKKVYSLKPHLGGYIIFDSSFKDVYFYSSPQATPQKIELIQNSSVGDLEPVMFDIQGTKAVTLFSRFVDDDLAEALQSLITIKTGSNYQTIELTGSFSKAVLCGNNICLVGQEKLQIYELQNSQLVLKRTLTGVKDLSAEYGRLLLVNATGILQINTESLEGNYLYAFGGFRYDILQQYTGGALVGVYDEKMGSISIAVNTTKESVDRIDQQVRNLASIPEVRSISLYGTYIFITPEYGEFVTDTQTGLLGPDKSQLNAASSAINKKIQELGIDRTRYEFNNFSQR